MNSARLLAGLVTTAAVVVVCTFACSTNSGSPGDAGSDATPEALVDATRDANAEVRTDDGTTDVTPDTPADGGAPQLIDLTVGTVDPSDAAPPVVLVPPFSRTTYDYTIACPAGGTASLRVSWTASTGATGKLTQPSTTKAAPSATVTTDLKVNGAIVAVALRGSASTEYWVRCLPSDFPTLQWEPLVPSKITPGYYLVGSSQLTPSHGYAIVLDGNGVPVWYQAAPPNDGVYNVDNIVDGGISYIPFPSVSPYAIHDLAAGTTTSVQPNGYYDNEHELRALPNGDFIVLSYPYQTGYDLTGMKITLRDGGTLYPGPDSSIQNCAVVEFNPKTGNVTWSWLATDHLDPVKDPTYPQVSIANIPAADGGIVYDIFHFNSVDVDPSGKYLLVSARHLDSVFLIEKSTYRIVWKLGGSTYTKDNATYIGMSDPFYRQHDARFVQWTSSCTGGSGQISVYDDETSIDGGAARAVIYDVDAGMPSDGGAADCGFPADGGEAGALTAKVAWEYKALASASSLGSFRITADGSRIIGWGGLPGRTFTEIDPSGTPVLQFHFNNVSYRAIKVPVDAFSLEVLRNTAGRPPS